MARTPGLPASSRGSTSGRRRAAGSLALRRLSRRRPRGPRDRAVPVGRRPGDRQRGPDRSPRRCSASTRRRAGLALLPRASSGSTSPKFFRGPARSSSSSPPACSPTGSTTSRRPASCPASTTSPSTSRARSRRAPGTARCSRARSTSRRPPPGSRRSPGSRYVVPVLTLFLAVRPQRARLGPRRPPSPCTAPPTTVPTPHRKRLLTCVPRIHRQPSRIAASARRPASAIAVAATRTSNDPDSTRRDHGDAAPTTRCDVSADQAPSGNLVFEVTNTGDEVTEFYLLGRGRPADRRRGREHRPRPHPRPRRPGSPGRLLHRVQARHGRRRHPRRLHGHRLRRGRRRRRRRRS